MTPKEKAAELISKFTFLSLPESNAKFYNPKQCALIAVEELLDTEDHLYWNEVRKEIEKL